ncbi:CPBP family intramembrane glutamic endopeptidase [Caldicellulosiruptor acetigenus]|uniref:CPBP family intramembrane glutamic endopeptidase n=1 Tax=Caldicellulosiruptor acetigenus TaxID=301953 RepID=UPI00041055F5|nr:CPBP family intramembrane glutamic endopeptidase [Caldicellulosiruptor acetigenus]WAM36122.1 CPBP family intramembrane metalloprotease [Caldicellulosiruptor acetigenus]
MKKSGIVSMGISMALVAPFFEEFIFRGLIFGVMQKNRLNIFVAIVVQALLFGLIHLNLYQGIFAFFIGIFLALALYWTGSIWSSIVMHFTVNSLAVIVILFSDSVNLNEEVSPKALILPFIIGVVLMCIAIKHFLSIKIRASK